MPDVVAAEAPEVRGKLQWVGMDRVELPVNLEAGKGMVSQIPAETDIYVNLIDETAKGIHMSRLFLAATSNFEDSKLSPQLINSILTEFLRSHEGISDRASLKLRFEYMCKRPALKSDNLAWRKYPVEILASKLRGEEMQLELGLDIQYSSTCPCSAALSRQMNQENFKESFSGRDSLAFEEILSWLGKRESVAATPHAQRSLAKVYMKLASNTENFEFETYIEGLEKALGTPVQAAVKREDEQEFARLNASNLMFGEDASRKLQDYLNSLPEVLDFRGKVSHFESLHPHDAVSSFCKNY